MNAETKLAWDIIETTNANLFLTGKAGTGKTTFLRELKRGSSKRMVVVAPTGIAAINAEGVTMHSFFQLPLAPYIPGATYGGANGRHPHFNKEKTRIIRAIDLLVIDEISMVRADVLDAVDEALRTQRRNSLPFGGVQLVMIGDLGQLAPVAKEEEWQMLAHYYASPYFFSSRALARTSFAVVELTHVYRQKDARFLELLNSIRENRAGKDTLAALNSRYIPHFSPSSGEGYIRLTTHNIQAQRINAEELSKIEGKPFTYVAEIEGKFPEYSFPTDERLTLKKGAQVMFVKNDSSPEKKYYNGMIGTITEIGSEGFAVKPKDGGEEIIVGPERWENCRYTVDERTKEITEEVEGMFVQMPVKAAWAITIHKSQGLTFDKAIIDAASSFAHGQTYVALSRCRSLEGMVLSSPLPASAIIRDSIIDSFAVSASKRKPTEDALRTMQRQYFLTLLNELFDFSEIEKSFTTTRHILEENFRRRYPKTVEAFAFHSKDISEKICGVAAKFRLQYERMTASAADYSTDLPLQGRIRKGAAYFLEELRETERLTKRANMKTDNKEIGLRTDNALKTLKGDLTQKCRLLAYTKEHGFTITGYLNQKSYILLGGKKDVPNKGGRKHKTTGKMNTPA